MENKNILIAGFGNIGTRYFQGLLTSNRAIKIHIFENNFSKIKKYNFNKIGIRNKKKIFYHKNNENLPKLFFLSIIATTADTRTSLIKSLSKKIKSKYWILEKPLCQSLKDLNFLKNFFIKKKAWVNLNRSSNQFYLNLKKKIKKKKITNLLVTGYNWGIGCNGLHYAQLMSDFIESDIFNIKYVKFTRWYETKRKNFWDVYGSIQFTINQNFLCTLENKFSSKSKSSTKLIFFNDKLNFTVDETKRKLYENNIIKKKNISLPVVSKDINSYLESLIKRKTCSLPSVKNSIKLHQMLLDNMIKSWKKLKKNKNNKIPIS